MLYPIKLPVSFDEVSYYRNEYRGDLIVTRGILYYFPHTRVAASHFSPEIGGGDVAEAIGVAGNFVPFLALAPHLHAAVDKSVKIGKFFGRFFLPSVNSPRIRNSKLWTGRDTNEVLQKLLD